MIYAFFIIPSLELLFKPDAKNADEAELELRKSDSLYDYLLYAVVPVQFGFLVWFLFAVGESGLTAWDITGRISGFGIMCGTIGINVAHELGHRVKKHEQFMAKALLLTSQYMHFFIEHNRGHHKNVSTTEDPSSARKNEWLPFFWIRSVVTGYISAWRLENKRLSRKYQRVFSLKNEMLRFLLIQVLLLVAIGVFFSPTILLYYAAAATFGFLMLETVNYIEHYGLQRQKVSEFRYENASPKHSWNSNHILGRMMLFELSRHSDHHFKAEKKYQLLEHHDDSPQMPTGYPGMMILAFVPPLWFWVMNKRLAKQNGFLD
jgi:alkane 1-monooxygenase